MDVAPLDAIGGIVHGKTNDLVAGYVRDMIAVENEMHAAFRRQKRDERLKIHAESLRIVESIEDTIDRHLGALRAQLTDLGGDESALKTALGSLLGAAAGFYDRMRSDEPASRMLRDDYVALSTAIVCYEMLHATAMAAGKPAVADLALAHLRDFTPLVMAITEAIPHLVVEELSREGKLPPDHAAAEVAARNTREAWMSRAPAQ
jgi:hypothetical protein